MLAFLRDRRPASLLILVLALLFIMMAVQVRAGGASDTETLLLRIASPVIRLSSGITGSLTGVWDGYVALRGLREDNKGLEAELTRLRLELHELEEARLQNSRLRSLLELQEGIGAPSLAATVVGNRAAGLSRTILINRGSADGVAPNMPVVAPDGIVGRVWSVTPHVSKVQLITDGDAGTAVLVQRTRVQGILLGRGADLCSMEYVSRLDDVQKGDLIVTNGLDGIYPKGLPIGPVYRIAQGQGILRRITVEPRVKFNRLEEVLVLLSSEISLPETPEPVVPEAAAVR